jgi:hypothetical protein
VWVGGVADLEGDPVADSGAVGVVPGVGDRGLVGVDAVHPQHRERSGQGDAGPAEAAADVEHPGRAAGQHRVQVGDRRQPGLRELVGERGPVEAALAVPYVVAVAGEADPGAVPERVEHGGQDGAGATGQQRDRRDVQRALLVGQRHGVSGGQRVAACVRVVGRRVHGEDVGDGLLFEPLPGIAGVDAGPLGELRGGRRVVECGVETELESDVDGVQLQGGDDRAEQPLGQRARGGLVIGPDLCGGHAELTTVAATRASVSASQSPEQCTVTRLMRAPVSSTIVTPRE